MAKYCSITAQRQATALAAAYRCDLAQVSQSQGVAWHTKKRRMGKSPDSEKRLKRRIGGKKGC
jgi:hypothetical protein